MLPIKDRSSDEDGDEVLSLGVTELGEKKAWGKHGKNGNDVKTWACVSSETDRLDVSKPSSSWNIQCTVPVNPV